VFISTANRQFSGRSQEPATGKLKGTQIFYEAIRFCFGRGFRKVSEGFVNLIEIRRESHGNGHRMDFFLFMNYSDP
jgi:hypothetical protein